MFESFDEIRETMSENQSVVGDGREHAVIANHTPYGYDGGENYEHDDTGDLMNYCGVQDVIFSAEALHQDWERGFDY